MSHVRLIHWHEEECDERLARLTAAGFAGRGHWSVQNSSLRTFREDPPVAIVIDLGRLPSHGREMATALRRSPATRQIPLIFVDGKPDKVAALQATFPDAPFTTWPLIGEVLRRAIKTPPRDPAIPPSHMDRFAGRPLVKKLGIPATGRVGLIQPPPDFADLLTPWPPDAQLVRNPRSSCELVVWFVRNVGELESHIDRYVELAGRGGLWIAWQKKSAKSRAAEEDALGQDHIFRVARAAGLVDNKVCAIDATWSALRFTLKRPEP